MSIILLFFVTLDDNYLCIRDYAASMWAVMSRFDLNLPDELNGSKIHRLENVMTLEPAFHIFFDRLKIWFISTVRPN